MNEEEVNELVDRIHSAKESLVLFGRQVFRISSDFGELSRTRPDSFRQLAAEHKLFANKEIVHAQMEEFYKASINYILSYFEKSTAGQLSYLAQRPQRKISDYTLVTPPI